MLPTATLKTQRGEIVFELYPDNAPNTVASFVKLADAGLFDNRPIKRIVPGWVLQPTYSNFDDERCAISLSGEFRANGFENPTVMRRGTLGLGGDGKSVSSPSCFFITLTDETGRSLQDRYTAFGQVISGWSEVERLINVPLKPVESGKEGVRINEPVDPEFIISVTVDRAGWTFTEPVMTEQEQR